jgi:hypothetical protein
MAEGRETRPVRSGKDKAMSAQVITKGTQFGTPSTFTFAARAWRRVRLAIQEMNYASRRVVEHQAPWTVDPEWYRR